MCLAVYGVAEGEAHPGHKSCPYCIVCDALGLFLFQRLLIRVQSIINCFKQQDSLNANLLDSISKCKMGHLWVFKQDNEPT